MSEFYLEVASDGRVTMQERGVSKTLSMRFDQHKGEAEVLPTTIADSVRAAAPSAPVGS